MRMIALVSDQRMQNLIPLLQQGTSYSELVLILSKERGQGQPSRRFVDAARDIISAVKMVRPGIHVTTCSDYVDPHDIPSNKALVNRLIQPHDNQPLPIVNITGGTKPMAIGALQGAQSANATCLYVDTENGELIWLGADGSTRAETFVLADLKVASYVRAYGEQIASCNSAQDLDPTLIAWVDTIVGNYAILYKSIIVQVMRALKDRAEGYPITISLQATRRQKQIVAELARQGLWEWDETNSHLAVTNQRSANFINGGWVECCVACQLQRSGLFQDVCTNIMLRGIEGEIDVAAVGGAKLVLIECKSNLKRAQQLGTLVAFKNKLGGPFAHAYYARAADDNQRSIVAQCTKLRVNAVFFGAELGTIGATIARSLGGP